MREEHGGFRKPITGTPSLRPLQGGTNWDLNEHLGRCKLHRHGGDECGSPVLLRGAAAQIVHNEQRSDAGADAVVAPPAVRR